MTTPDHIITTFDSIITTPEYRMTPLGYIMITTVLTMPDGTSNASTHCYHDPIQLALELLISMISRFIFNF